MISWNKIEKPQRHKDKHFAYLKKNRTKTTCGCKAFRINKHKLDIAHAPTTLGLYEALLRGRIWDKRGSAVVSKNLIELCESYKP